MWSAGTTGTCARTARWSRKPPEGPDDPGRNPRNQAKEHVEFPGGRGPRGRPRHRQHPDDGAGSLLSDRQGRTDVAMTGEVSLTGRVLPIGGLEQKLPAAHRAGITTVVIPKRNEADLDDVPAEILGELEIHPVTDVRRVLAIALSPAQVPVTAAA
ncbi:S16 family serine protease [Streptomyces sp. NPDC087658]|uniref:S16 family serine protease n=1 Tax=Streptomyces sp. NPDC087658 TaxID=3365800 RepID=UPI0037FE6648